MLYLLPSAVDRAAGREPDRDAIRCSGASLSYGELSEQSNRLAHVLRERGVRRGDRVGILAAKGLLSGIAIHGIMKAGAAYVPLDPTAPLGRTAIILRDCGIRHLVSETAKTSDVDALLRAGAELDTAIGVDPRELPGSIGVAWEEVESAPADRIDTGTTELDLAYVLYTSGSTGTPKGVVHTHRSGLAFAEIAAHTYGLRSTDRVSNHAPLHFDLSTLDYFAAAVAGATTVVVPEAYAKLPASLSKLIQDERLTVLYAVPLALAHLLRHGALEKRDLTSLRWVLFGGEPFAPKHLRDLMRRLPQARFANVYGPTEVNGVTHWIVPPIADESDEPIPIGRAYENVELLVVDETGLPVAGAEEEGELWVRSPTMMRGYWGRPDLDERAFAFRSQEGPGDRVYHRTGDLVRVDETGVIHFIGRRDRQIKTRGYRVELDEVESVLTSHPQVETAAVFGVPDADDSTAIEAAVVLAKGGSVLPTDLLRHAAGALPVYAVPERLDIVDTLPRTSTDKIDRVSLRAAAVERRALASKGLPA